MVKPNKGPSRSSDAVLQTLGWVRKQGFRPVPLHPESKAAISRDYVDPGYQPPPDELWKTGDYGIGVVTGPRHSGPIDIDLDCEEAVFFAPTFLPPTEAVFGRKSKLRSHYLYRIEGTDFDKRALLDPTRTKDSTIVEMRGDAGHQTVFPGSIHEDTKELVEWDNKIFPNVTTVPADVLSRAVNKIAIATLVVRYMWEPGYHNEPCKHLSGIFFYLDWSQDEAEQFIEAVMNYSGDDDKSRIPTVRATYRRGLNGKKVTGAGALRKQLQDDRVVDRLLEWAGSETVNLLQEYNERFAVVAMEGKFRVAMTDMPASEPPMFFAKDDFLNVCATDCVEIDDKKVPKAKIWLANPRRRTYRNVDFLPGTDEFDAGNVLNLWTGWAVPPSVEGSCEKWLELLRDVVCGGDAELIRWMECWFANMFREPMRKPMTSPVLIGKQGAGKSLLIGYVGDILGMNYMVVTDEEHIYGRFNSHLSTSLLLHSEEALHGGEKKHRGIIKSLITDEYRMFEPKHVNPRRVKNYLRLILTSNHMRAAPAEAGDRRFTVIDMDKRQIPDALIKAVKKERANGGPARLHHYFMNELDYDPDVPRVNLKNDALSSLKSENLDPVEAWWYDCLTEGQLLPDIVAWAQRPEKERWPSQLGSSTLYSSMVDKLRQRGVRNIPQEAGWATLLNKLVGLKLIRAQRRYVNPLPDNVPRIYQGLSDRQNSILNMPDLNECRKAFADYTGQTIIWPEDEPEGDIPPYEKI